MTDFLIGLIAYPLGFITGLAFFYANQYHSEIKYLLTFLKEDIQKLHAKFDELKQKS